MSLTASISVSYACDTPRPGDEADLQRLHAQAMPGDVSLSLWTEPDYQQALTIQGDRQDTVVIRRRDDERIVAMGSRSVRELWINGRPQRVGYLSGLRNKPGVRLPRRLIAETFDRLLSMRYPDEAPFDLTSIMSDNHTARRALERGVRGMPGYSPIGEMVTLTLPATRRHPLTPPLRRLVASDIPRITALLRRTACESQGRPYWNEESLLCSESCSGLRADDFVGYEEAGELIACGAVWDQRPFKQTVVTGLSPTLARWRPWINLGCRCTGRVPLPRPGAALSMVYASHLAFPGNRPEVWRCLLGGLRSRAAKLGAEAVVLGLPGAHPLIRQPPIRRHAWRTLSMLYAVHRRGFLQFDGRPVWPEVAVL